MPKEQPTASLSLEPSSTSPYSAKKSRLPHRIMLSVAFSTWLYILYLITMLFSGGVFCLIWYFWDGHPS